MTREIRLVSMKVPETSIGRERLLHVEPLQLLVDLEDVVNHWSGGSFCWDCLWWVNHRVDYEGLSET